MNAFHCVFSRQGKPFVYSMGAATLADEEARGRSMHGSEAFGDFRYARQVAQRPLDTRSLYRFTPSSTRLQWRDINEDVQGAFDYVKLSGSHLDEACLPVLVPARIEGLDETREMLIWLKLNAARSGKLASFFEQYLFSVRLRNGAADLVGFKHAYADTPDIGIRLEVLR